MKHLLSLTIDGKDFEAPAGVPTGGIDTLSKLLSTVMNVLIIFGIIVSLMFVLWAGINWISSGGDKQKLDKARKTLLWAIIGLVILLLSLVAFRFVNDLLGAGLKVT